MKNINIILTFLLLATYQLSAQNCGVLTCTPTSECSCVSCTVHSNDDWGSGSEAKVDILATCYETGGYNCHQYVRTALYLQQSMGISLNYFIPSCGNPTSPGTAATCPCNKFSQANIINDPAFVKVCSQNLAQVVYYNVNHSGLINYSPSSGSNVVNKAVASDPLIVSPLNYWGPPNAFYAFIGAIQGATTLSSTNTYSVINRPGLSYQWSVQPAGRVSFVNSNSTGNSVQVEPKCNGPFKIYVTVTSDCIGESVTQCLDAMVTGHCCSSPCTLTGTYTSNGSNNYTLDYVNTTYAYATVISVGCSEEATTFVWTKTSGDGSYYEPIPGGNTMYIYLLPGQYLPLP